MQKKLVALVVVLLVCSTLGAFAGEKKSAQIPWLASLNSPGTTDITLTGGWVQGGIGAAASFGLTFGQFDLGPFPLSWGMTAVADAGFGYGVSMGAGAFVTLEMAADFGGMAKFEGLVGIGPGVTFNIGGYSFPFGFGIGEYNSWTWWFSSNMGLNFTDVFVYTWEQDLYANTIGIDFKL
jgi:hypothetical protein